MLLLLLACAEPEPSTCGSTEEFSVDLEEGDEADFAGDDGVLDTSECFALCGWAMGVYDNESSEFYERTDTCAVTAGEVECTWYTCMYG